MGGWVEDVLEERRTGGGGLYQKWADQIFPIIKFVFSRDGPFGLGGGFSDGRSNDTSLSL